MTTPKSPEAEEKVGRYDDLIQLVILAVVMVMFLGIARCIHLENERWDREMRQVYERSSK